MGSRYPPLVHWEQTFGRDKTAATVTEAKVDGLLAFPELRLDQLRTNPSGVTTRSVDQYGGGSATAC